MPQQSSPLLDDYNNTGIVTPALQRALQIARQKLPQFTLPTAPDAPRQLAPPGAAQVPSITRDATPQTGPGVTDPDAAAHQAERDRLVKTGSGISQVQNPVGRGLLRAADVIGSAFAPRITAGIPGTELHHNYLVKQAEGTVDKDVARAKEKAGTAEEEARTAGMPTAEEATTARDAEAGLKTAQTGEANARTKSLGEADKAEAKTVETDQGVMQWNPETKRYDIPVGAAPGKLQENTHVLPDGTVVAVHNDPKTGKSTAEVLYQGKPAEKPGHVIQRMVNGKLHNILVDAETGADRQDLGEGRQPNPADHGATVIGPDGRVIRLEPGQIAPSGFTTPQQAGSTNAAEAKGFRSANDAVQYGQDYLKSGTFTGPKDEALMEAFFEVAKPSSGFRMSQPQIDMLMKGRSWMDSAEGIAYHAKNGVWFPPNQRQQIVDAMQARAASKNPGGGGSTPATIRARDPQGKLHEAPAGTALPAGWKAEK